MFHVKHLFVFHALQGIASSIRSTVPYMRNATETAVVVGAAGAHEPIAVGQRVARRPIAKPVIGMVLLDSALPAFHQLVYQGVAIELTGMGEDRNSPVFHDRPYRIGRIDVFDIAHAYPLALEQRAIQILIGV